MVSPESWEEMIDILSYGGGKQTIAMCVLVARGILPRPDYVIAADTGREMPSTWEYADAYARPLLASVGLDLHIAPHDLATVDLYGKNGDMLMPLFTSNGKFPTYCSGEWKARVVDRYARTMLGVADYTAWIGFSLDERRRIKGRDGKRFPLIDLNLTQADCIAIIQGAGLPIPPKSRCYMCPHQHNAEWREVRADPALWNSALAIDEEMRDADERGAVFLHADRVPLAQADINREDRNEPSRQCGMGMCYV
jgi:hypothetical protein